MDLTRQTWRTAAVTIALAGIAPLTGSVVPIMGAAAVAGWLLAVQVAAVRSLRSTAAVATVRVEFDATRTAVGNPVAATVAVERPEQAAGTALTVTYPTPAVAEPIPEADRRVTLTPSETVGSTTFSLQSSVPGRLRLPEPTWRLVDASGSVTESYSHGPTPAIDVIETAGRARQTVGATPESPPFGEGANGKMRKAVGSDRLRPYEATDPATKIDWNTTARLGEPYVRETASQRGQPTSLIVDHRAKLLAGPTDAPMFESVRSVALGVVATAADRGDPLALVTVGDEGPMSAVEPTTHPAGYDEIRRRLQELEPTPIDQAAGIEIDHPEPPGGRDFGSSNHAVGRLLEAFGTESAATNSRGERWPLVEGVQCQRSATAPGSTVIITDDTDRAELWAAVRAALHNATSVAVYLTPRIRFDAEHTARTVRAADRYQEFERFRRRLDGIDAVVAREVTPTVDGWAEQPDVLGDLTRQAGATGGEITEETNRQPIPTATAAASNGSSNE